MALYRCSGGGSSLTRITLWTNPSPTSSFAAQSITLSDNITNYAFIGVAWANATSSDVTYELLSTPDDLHNVEVSTSIASCPRYMAFSIALKGSSGTSNRYRRCWRRPGESANSLSFDDCYDRAGTKFNTSCIPRYVYGYK